jgi:hypothetical protein
LLLKQSTVSFEQSRVTQPMPLPRPGNLAPGFRFISTTHTPGPAVQRSLTFSKRSAQKTVAAAEIGLRINGDKT